MIVKYCPKCTGRPYTKKQDVHECPVCGTALFSELVSDSALAGRSELSFDRTASGFGSGSGFGTGAWGSDAGSDPWDSTGTSEGRGSTGEPTAWGTATEDKTSFGQDTSAGFDSFGDSSFEQNKPATPKKDASWDIDDGIFGKPLGGIEPTKQQDLAQAKAATPSFFESPAADKYFSGANSDGIVRGKVFNYSNTEIEGGGYRRMPHDKLLDAIRFGQRTEDLLHRFTVRTGAGTSLDSAYSDTMVNVHGTIYGGMRIADNETVEVKGSFRNGILMARNIDAITGGGRTTVKFQRNVGGIAALILAAIILIFALYIWANYGNAIAENFVPFMTTWVVCAIVIGVLYILVLPRMGGLARSLSARHGAIPLVLILLSSLLLTMILLNSFGIGAALGSTFSGIIAAILPTVIIIAVMIYLLKMIIHP